MSERILRVQGQAEVSAPPDQTTISFDVKALSQNYGDSIVKLNEAAERLRQSIEKAGLSRNDLKTASFSVDARHDHENNRRVFRGYEARHGMRIVLPMDRELLNCLLGIVAGGVSSPEFELSFGVKDDATLRQKALIAAVEAAKRNASTLAVAAGLTLGKIERIEYGWAEVRVSSETYSMQNAVCESAAPDLTPSDVTASESVTVFWEIK